MKSKHWLAAYLRNPAIHSNATLTQAQSLHGKGSRPPPPPPAAQWLPATPHKVLRSLWTIHICAHLAGTQEAQAVWGFNSVPEWFIDRMISMNEKAETAECENLVFILCNFTAEPQFSFLGDAGCCQALPAALQLSVWEALMYSYS